MKISALPRIYKMQTKLPYEKFVRELLLYSIKLSPVPQPQSQIPSKRRFP